MASNFKSTGRENAEASSQLAGIEPCTFPPFDEGEANEEKLLRIDSTVKPTKELKAIYERDRNGLYSLLRTSWALVLSCYTGLDDVCFGYEEARSGKRNENDGRARGTGLVRIDLSGEHTMEEVVSIQRKNKPVPLPKSKEGLFNTVVILKDGYVADEEHSANVFANHLEAPKIHEVCLLFKRGRMMLNSRSARLRNIRFI